MHSYSCSVPAGVPERDTKALISYARKNNKVVIGPATVGGIQVCTQAQGTCIKVNQSWLAGAGAGSQTQAQAQTHASKSASGLAG